MDAERRRSGWMWATALGALIVGYLALHLATITISRLPWFDDSYLYENQSGSTSDVRMGAPKRLQERRSPMGRFLPCGLGLGA